MFWAGERDGGAVRINSGDEVFVTSVQAVNRSELRIGDPIRDAFSYFSNTAVRRKDGGVEPLTWFVHYTHPLALGPWAHAFHDDQDDGYSDYMSDVAVTWDKIVRRILALPDSDAGGWITAANRAVDVERTLDSLRADPPTTVQFEEFIDEVALAAYALGRIDAEGALARDAKRGVEARHRLTKATARAALARRALGDSTRQKARELMRRKPHLTWSGCASEIADGRDTSGVRQVIKSLFPLGPDGRRTYREDDPADRPDASSAGPTKPLTPP